MADCFYSKEWLYAGSSHPAYCSFRSSPESRPQTGRPGVREESPEASPAPGDGESGAHLKVTIRPTTSHLPAAHPESMPRFLLHFCSYTTAPQTSLVVAIDPWPLPSGHLVVRITYQWGGVWGQGWQMRQTHFTDEERHDSSDISSEWQTEPRLELLGKQLNCIESPIRVWELEESMAQGVPGFVRRENGTIHVSQAVLPRRTETLGASAPWTRPVPWADVQSTSTLSYLVAVTVSSTLQIAPLWNFSVSQWGSITIPICKWGNWDQKGWYNLVARGTRIWSQEIRL